MLGECWTGFSTGSSSLLAETAQGHSDRAERIRDSAATSTLSCSSPKALVLPTAETASEARRVRAMEAHEVRSLGRREVVSAGRGWVDELSEVARWDWRLGDAIL